MFFEISKRHKTAQFGGRDPERAAQAVVNMITVLASYLPFEDQIKFKNSVRAKLAEVSASEVAQHKASYGSRIGQSISFVKNFLSGQSEMFVNDVLKRIMSRL